MKEKGYLEGYLEEKGYLEDLNTEYEKPVH